MQPDMKRSYSYCPEAAYFSITSCVLILIYNRNLTFSFINEQHVIGFIHLPIVTFNVEDHQAKLLAVVAYFITALKGSSRTSLSFFFFLFKLIRQALYHDQLIMSQRNCNMQNRLFYFSQT